jgi:hypothetical protein
MKKLSTKGFLSQIVTLAAVVGLSNKTNFSFGKSVDDEFYKRMVLANNQEVTKLIVTLSIDITEIRRRLGYDLANLSAALTEPTSQFYQKEQIVPYLDKIMRFLLKAQNEDGTLDIGNLASPPDTAFILEPLCSALKILNINEMTSLNEVKKMLKTFILKSGEGLRLGGIHTPNHRWVVSAALARINDLFPDKKYVNRIDEWLSEGVFIDKNGHYLERSMIYGEVTDRALMTMGRLLNRPKLYEPVRKNLTMIYFYTEPNGDLVCNDSRRQDQFASINILNFYHDYRFFAIHDNNAEFAAITKFIENVKGFEEKIMNDLLFYFLEEPLYKKPMPQPKSPSVNFEKFFESSNLVRIRKNETTTTIFGGTDLPLIIGSGRSTSPNLFAFRKGEAILKYLRYSTDFFSTGYFRSKGIKKVDGKYILSQKIEAPYYQPLPAKYKRADADYKHSQSTDGRFWNKMDFEHRPQSNIRTLETTITVEEKNGVNELTFSTKGTDGVHVTIEFCFNTGGTFSGLKKLEDSTDNYSLASGSGEYHFGKDSIKIDGGIFEHSKLKGLDGEMYTSHFGTLRTEGMHVYFTGITPFEHKIVIG